MKRKMTPTSSLWRCVYVTDRGAVYTNCRGLFVLQVEGQYIQTVVEGLCSVCWTFLHTQLLVSVCADWNYEKVTYY